MDAILNVARRLDWPEERLHHEYFAAAHEVSKDGTGFDLQIASNRLVIPVHAGQSALAALRNASIDIPMSCEQGVCGTCLTLVKAGTPDHRDWFSAFEHPLSHLAGVGALAGAMAPKPNRFLASSGEASDAPSASMRWRALVTCCALLSAY
jgi:ferredoxin